MEYLVESALLTHGLKSVSNETIKKEWQDPGKKITWIDHGEIRIGDIDEFLEFRSRASAYPRIDCDLLEKALVEKQSGALTASGTMAVCVKNGNSGCNYLWNGWNRGHQRRRTLPGSSGSSADSGDPDLGRTKRYAGPESNDRLADIARSEGDRNRKKLLYRLCILWRKS